MRQEAASALGEMKAAEAVPDLIRVLKVEGSRDRNNAARALGKIKAAAAVPVLIRALNDKEVSLEAAGALEEINAAEAVPALIRALKKPSEVIKEELVRLAVGRAAKKILTSMPIPAKKKERRKQVLMLRKLIALQPDYGDRLSIAERLSVLDVSASPYQDAFESVKPSSASKILRSAFVTLSIILILGLIAILDILYGTAQNVFKSLIDPTIYLWILSHPLIALFGLAILIGLLTWGVDRLKVVLVGRNKSQ